MYKSDIEHSKILDNFDSKSVKNLEIRLLLGEEAGSENYLMRYFKLGKDGYTPLHRHDWEHLNFFVKGKGIVYVDGKEYEVKPGDTVRIAPNELHQYKNAGEENFEFICLIPAKR
jgi:quercetin dioxygenase-like cupin family protein